MIISGNVRRCIVNAIGQPFIESISKQVFMKFNSNQIVKISQMATSLYPNEDIVLFSNGIGIIIERGLI